MSTTKLVYWGGSKGGVGKSTNAHLSCLGAILCGQAAAYVLTDPDREIRDKGRPYEVLDGREPKQLASILKASRTTSGGWLIIDGGGNRPVFDEAIAEEVDLCIFPFRPSHEDMEYRFQRHGKDQQRVGMAHGVAYEHLRHSGRARIHQPTFEKISFTGHYQGHSICEFGLGSPCSNP